MFFLQKICSCQKKAVPLQRFISINYCTFIGILLGGYWVIIGLLIR